MKRDIWRTTVALSICLATAGLSDTVWGQAAREWETTVPWHNNDYFAHTHDSEVRALLRNVEDAHLGKKFWAYYRQGEYHYAIDDVKYVLLLFPNHPKALELMRVIGRLTKKPAMPAPWFQKAVTMFPRHALTRAQFGAYLIEIGEVERAIGELRKATEMDAQLGYAYGHLARAYHKAGDEGAARVAADRAKRLGFRGGVAD
jgi:predicted Zn-dependent protease